MTVPETLDQTLGCNFIYTCKVDKVLLNVIGIQFSLKF